MNADRTMTMLTQVVPQMKSPALQVIAPLCKAEMPYDYLLCVKNGLQEQEGIESIIALFTPTIPLIIPHIIKNEQNGSTQIFTAVSLETA